MTAYRGLCSGIAGKSKRRLKSGAHRAIDYVLRKLSWNKKCYWDRKRCRLCFETCARNFYSLACATFVSFQFTVSPFILRRLVSHGRWSGLLDPDRVIVLPIYSMTPCSFTYDHRQSGFPAPVRSPHEKTLTGG